MPVAHDVPDHKVRGDILTADDWNALARLAKLDQPQGGGDEDPPWYNAAGSTCPAYGVAAVTGTHGTSPDKIAQGDKPSATYRKDYIVNTDTEVATTKEGTYQNTPMVKALYYSSGTPAVGELWGPTEGQWYLSKGSTGNGDSNTTYTRADWGIVVAGIVDSTNKVLLGRIVEKGRARMCLCQADPTSAPTLDKVDNITSMDGGWAPVAAAADELSVVSGFETDNNAVGVIVYDEKNDNWRALDFPCPA